MLVFEDKFTLGDRRSHCTLWAREPEFKHINFEINLNILPNAKEEAPGVCDLSELALCERERFQIEGACRRAFANRPSKHIEPITSSRAGGLMGNRQRRF
jgi:hypothetical protein